jgi:hypothetical protein
MVLWEEDVHDALTLIHKRDINGYYLSACAIGTSVHVITTSDINYVALFARPFDRFYFEDMTDDEYTAMVRRTTETEAITLFVKNLTEELTMDGKLPQFVRLSMMLTKWDESLANKPVYVNGLARQYVQVSSFDISTLNLDTETNKLDMNITGAFLPFMVVQAYSAIDTMIIATPGFDYTQELWDYNYYMYMLVVDLNGASSQVLAVGQVPGLLLNEYAVDVMDDTLRIGTTVTLGSDNITSEFSTANTTNYISTLQIPSMPGIMELVGQIELGKHGEQFSFLRFFDNIAYAVARGDFDDTVYVLDLSNPKDPQVVGVLNPIALLDYMHPMNEDNTLLMTIGRDADIINASFFEFLGLYISVLDVRNSTKPSVIQYYYVKHDKPGHSSSDALMGFKSFRYDRQTTLKCGIQQQFTYNATQNVCLSCAYLSSRSMMFDDNVTMLSDYFIDSTNLGLGLGL